MWWEKKRTWKNQDSYLEEEAKKRLKRARQAIGNPGDGMNIGPLSARFTVTDEYGNEVARFAEVNDHIRIDIPGLGNSAGDGFDWVQVKSIGEKTDTRPMRTVSA